jgi:hypothetical protein
MADSDGENESLRIITSLSRFGPAHERKGQPRVV